MVEESTVTQEHDSQQTTEGTPRTSGNKAHSNGIAFCNEALSADNPLAILSESDLDWISSPKYGDVTGNGVACGDLTLCENGGEVNRCYIDQDLERADGFTEICNEDFNQVSSEVCYGDVSVIESTGVHVGTNNFFYGPVNVKQVVALDRDEVRSPTQPLPTTTKEAKWRWKGSLKPKRKKLLLGLAVLAGCFIAAVTVALVFTLPSEVYADKTDTWNLTMKMKTREDWYAEPPQPDALKPLLVLPPKYVMVAHTASSSCTTELICRNSVRGIQANHIALGYDDIGYNFLVGGDGFIYEGRGWDHIGAHTIGYNTRTLGLAFIGNFLTSPPPENQLEAAKTLLREGVTMGKLDPNYKIIVQKQVKPTESPGEALIEVLKTWPHWSVCDRECRKSFMIET